MARTRYSSLETLEARIAPAAVITHPFLDIVAGFGKTSTTLDLSTLVDPDPAASFRTWVEFTTNWDADPVKVGLQPGKIVIELFDDKAPLTVANFKSYVQNTNNAADYDGTFFHRAVDQSDLQILQGGGYNSSNFSHLPTYTEVTNEYDPSDSERANTYGTIAMAKVGGDPNSATSEFFFNLGDNSQTLNGDNNGGFTVFGKVVSGIEVLEAMFAQGTYNFGDPFKTLPTNKTYDADPDRNGDENYPTPAPNQLLQITTAKVLARPSFVPNYSYSIVSIVDTATAGTETPVKSNVVSGRIAGDNLTLTYSSLFAGEATVTVAIKDRLHPTDEPVYAEFNVTVKPDLVASTVKSTLPSYTVAGDTGVATLELFNGSGGTAKGTVDVKYYLSLLNDADPDGLTLDASDVVVGSLTDAAVNVRPGKSALLNVPLQLPDGTILEEGSYRLIAQVTTDEDSGFSEIRADNNVTENGQLLNYYGNEILPNLSTVDVTTNLSYFLVPGDKGLAKVTVANTSSHALSGKVDVQLFLSFIDDLRVGGDVLSQADLLIGTQLGANLTLAPGKTATFNTNITIPQLLTLATANVKDDSSTEDIEATFRAYQIYALVTPVEEGTGTFEELAYNDNLGASGKSDFSGYHELENRFGNVAFNTIFGTTVVRKNVVLSYLSANDVPEGAEQTYSQLQMQLKGAGYGFLGLSDIGIEVALEGTNLGSTFNVLAPAGVLPVITNIFSGGVSDSVMGTMNLGSVQLAGDLVAFGGLRSLTLGATLEGASHLISIMGSAGARSVSTTLNLGAMVDTSIESLLPIAKLTAASFTNVSSNAESLFLPSVGVFSVTGDLEANMLVTREFLNPTQAQGFVPASDAAFYTPAIKSFTVGGTMAGSTVISAGSIGTAKIGAMNASKLLVGTGTVPNSINDFAFNRTIGTLEVLGVNGGPAFTDSDIAVAGITYAKIGTVAASSGVDDFGLVVDRIAKYQSGIAPLRTNLSAPGEVDVQGNYRLLVV